MTTKTNFHIMHAITGVIARPGATFKIISHDPDRYLVSSVAIFATVCLVSTISVNNIWFEQDNGIFRGFDDDGVWYARSLISIALQNFLIIAVIFWVGSRYGGNCKFRNVFPVLAHCLISIMIVTVVITAGMQFADELLAFMYGGNPYGDTGSLPSYRLEFSGGSDRLILYNAIVFSLLAWVFALFVKAIKISYGFGTEKSIGVLALAIGAAYALAVVHGTINATVLS